MKKWLIGCLVVFAAIDVGATPSDEAAGKELEGALHLKPNIENGRQVYQICATCHMPEGWGTEDGYYPHIAGQHASVTIKQLADIRARNRNAPTMFPFAKLDILKLQDIADVAAYIEGLPMAPVNDVGPGNDLKLGHRLYIKYCAECHGNHGEGDSAKHMPMVQGQHYRYLLRQYLLIKHGTRRNADKEMVQQIHEFTARETTAVLDYVSRLRPPPGKVAPSNWVNQDLGPFVRLPPPPIEN